MSADGRDAVFALRKSCWYKTAGYAPEDYAYHGRALQNTAQARRDLRGTLLS